MDPGESRAEVGLDALLEDRAIERLGAAPERVHVIRGSTAAVFRRPPAADDVARVRSRYGLRAPYVLAVGTLEPRKNLSRLIQAFSILRREGRTEHLVLVGQRGWKYRADSTILSI